MKWLQLQYVSIHPHPPLYSGKSSCHQKSHKLFNGVHQCAIKVSHDLNINTSVPGRPQKSTAL